MCLITFSWNPQAQEHAQRLVLAANRDEFYRRATAPAHWWHRAGVEGMKVLAGRDLETPDQFGTWMGITQHGRIAMLTNYRSPNERKPQAKSRGLLVADFLLGKQSPYTYLHDVMRRSNRFNGFNLIVGELYGNPRTKRAPNLWLLAGRSPVANLPPPIPVQIEPGVYGLSNGALDTPWPKTVRATAAMSLLNAGQVAVTEYLKMLSDDSHPADRDLPDTGVGRDWERALSSIFIATPEYGTRSQTVIMAQANGHMQLTERTIGPSGVIQADSTAQFDFVSPWAVPGAVLSPIPDRSF